MTFVSTVRVRFKPEAASEVERLFNEQFAPSRRRLHEQGDLQSMVLVRSESEAGAYELVTHWASKEAHARNENSAEEQVFARAVGGYVASPLDEFDGTVVAAIR